MMMGIRAGGYKLTENGWELEEGSQPDSTDTGAGMGTGTPGAGPPTPEIEEEMASAVEVKPRRTVSKPRVT